MAVNGPGSPDHPLSFAPVWAETLGLIRRHGDLMWPLAAAFIFLPQLLVAVLMPAPVEGQTPDFASSLLILSVGAAGFAATLLGQISLASLAVNDGTAGQTLGQVIRRCARLVLPALAVVLIQGIGVLVGTFLLILPGLWLLSRLSVALPTVAAGQHDPIEALKESWRLTDGYALRIFGCLAILTLGILLIYISILSIGVAVGAISTIAAGAQPGGWGIGRWAFEVIAAGVVAGLGIISMCFYASLLKVLRALPRDPA